jgi:hypothetical protein
MAAQEQIHQKYQSAFQEMERRQVRVTDETMQGEKLYVLAWAASEEAKNEVWNEIKRVDPNYGDLICDIRVGEPAAVHSEFDRVASSTGPEGLAHGLSETFRSDQTPSFSQMLSHLFGHSSGPQKAGLLNSLAAVTPGALAAEVAEMIRGGRKITPEQAEKVPPETVQKIAENAERQNPTVVDRMSEFYAQHPNVVKTLGVGALTVLTSKLVGGLRRRSGGGGG